MKTRAKILVSLGWLTGVLCLAACASRDSRTEIETQQRATESWTASRTDAPGVYRVGPVLDALERVEVGRGSGTSPLTPEAWSYDAESGELTLSEPVGREAKVHVHGVRAFPWAWRGHEDWDPSTVRVLHGERELERGRDFAVDADARILRFLSPELCTPEARYFVVYRNRGDPRYPEQMTSIAFGNHDGDAARRRFLGLPEPDEEHAQPAAVATSIGTNAIATDDPAVFTISSPLRAEGLRAAIARQNGSGELTWLKPAQFTYDGAAGRLTLLGGLRPGDGEYVFVSGTPARTNVVRLHRAFDPATVRVVVGERRLEPGKDFRVDGEAGTVTILDPAFLERGAQYYVQAGNLGVGNYRDSDRLTALLRD